MLIFNNNKPIKQKQWINTKVEFEWSEELQKYVEISSDGYWYDGEMALCGTLGATTFDDHVDINDGTNGTSPHIVFGNEPASNVSHKGIWMESYYMYYQGHENEGHIFQFTDALDNQEIGLKLTGNNNAAASVASFFPAGGKVGIGTTSPAEELHLYSTAANSPAVLLHNENDSSVVGAVQAPILEFYQQDDNGGVADETDVGIIKFSGHSKNGTPYPKYTTAAISGSIQDPGNGSGRIIFSVAGGSGNTTVLQPAMTIRGIGVAETRVGIGTDSPGRTLDINHASTAPDLRLGCDGNDRSLIILDADRSSAGNSLGTIVWRWNNTDTAIIESFAGTDTTNKDDGGLTFQTRASGGALATAMTIATDQNVTFAGDVIVDNTSSNNNLYLKGTNGYPNEIGILHSGGADDRRAVIRATEVVSLGGKSCYTADFYTAGANLSSYGSAIRFYTSSETSASAVALTLGHDKSATFAGTVTSSGFTSTWGTFTDDIKSSGGIIRSDKLVTLSASSSWTAVKTLVNNYTSGMLIFHIYSTGNSASTRCQIFAYNADYYHRTTTEIHTVTGSGACASIDVRIVRSDNSTSSNGGGPYYLQAKPTDNSSGLAVSVMILTIN